jgi:amino acid adenylation domain-containing protein
MKEYSISGSSLPPQQEAIRAKCFHPTGTFIEFTKDEIEQSIPDCFERIVSLYPDCIAVKMKERALSYNELNRAANRIAHAVLQGRGERQEQVALLCQHGTAAIAATLALLKAGKTYVPLDPGDPKTRKEYILGDARIGLIITDDENISFARDLAPNDAAVINIDALESTLSSENPGLRISPDRLSYLMYTSGSTGEPKGVVQNHRNVLYKTMGWVNAVRISPGDRLSLLRSLNVSGSIRDLFGGLLSGAAVLPFDVKREGLVHLASWLVDEKITIYNSVVTLFRNLGDTLTGAENFSSVRLIKLSGEPVYKHDLEIYKKFFPKDTLVVNMLASSEVGSTRIYFIDKETPIHENVVPIGYPMEGCDVLLLGSDGSALGFDQIGEIAVRSRYLSPGYWRRPDLTEAAFLPDPEGGDARIFRTGDLGCMLADGCLLHRGRKDLHVKIRGYSVELAEIEAALMELDAVKQAAVTTKEQTPGNQVVVAYLVPTGQWTLNVNAIRKALAVKLPEYMIPSAFVFLASLPLIGPGKVNFRALPDPGRVRPDLETLFVAPRTEIEKDLAKIWCEVLSLDQVGIQDNFFDLGGHSLVAARLFAEIEKTLGRRLPLGTIFQAPTIEQLAGIVVQEEWSETQFSIWSTYPSAVVPFQPNGSKPPLFWFNWGPWDFRLPRYLSSDQPVYGLQHQSQDGHRALYTSIEAMAAHYIKEIRAIRAKGPYYLGGLCIGGMVAFEIAQQLQKQDEEVPLLVLIDPAKSRSGELSSAFQGEPSSSSHIAWIRNKVYRHLRDLAPLGPQEQLSYALVRAQNRITGLRGKINWMGRRVLCEAFGRPLPPPLRTDYIVSIYQRANQAYAPEAYRGRVILFKTQGRYRSGYSGWENLLAGESEIEELDTDHDTVFKEPYVQILGDKLRTRLNNIETNVTARRDSTVSSLVQ